MSSDPLSEPIRVLVGDDDTDFAEATCDFLDRKGFSATWVDSVNDLYREAVLGAPDVVVSDYDYGVKASRFFANGVAVGVRLREDEVPVPFVIHSGLERPDAIEAGFPFCEKGDFDNLVRVINKLVEGNA